MGNHKNNGMAVIVVLVVIAVLTPLSIALLANYQKLFSKIVIEESYSSGLNYALFGEDFARGALQQDRKANNYDYYASDEVWTHKLTSIPIDGGILSGRIEDLNGKFNVNNLYLAKNPTPAAIKTQIATEKAFIRLLKNLSINDSQVQEITNSIKDWLDQDSDVTTPYGAEDTTYESLAIPYLSSNSMLVDISELRLINGISPEIFARISPCLTALPIFTKININTSHKPIINAFMPKQYVYQITSSVNICGTTLKTNYQTLDAFLKTLPDISNQKLSPSDKQAREDAKKLLPSLLGVSSDFFVAKITAIFGTSNVNLQTYLFRSSSKVKVLFRSLGKEITPIKPAKKKQS